MSKYNSSSSSVTAYSQRGLKAYKTRDYDKAIAYWERANTLTLSPAIKAALAEAYFQRGVKTQQEEDLRKAIELQPNDPRFIFHLGLLAHRQGKKAEAVAAYEKAGKVDAKWQQRVVYPLALLYMAEGKDVRQTAVWPHLTSAEKKLLEQSQAILSHHPPVAEDPLWSGISEYNNGRFSAAQTHLTNAAAHNPSKGISHYYLGCIAAQQSDWETARRHWLLAHKAGYASPNLQTNLGELFHRLAEQYMGQNDLPHALDAALEAKQHKTDDKTLNDLLAYIQHQIGYEAVQSGDWGKAEMYLQRAELQAGGSFRLAYNRALVYEKLELYQEAAEQWREALRRRPRRTDHPDAISDEQVSRLWQRAAEAYAKADEFDESLRVYKQAVKWQPDNLTLRMALAEGLLDDGRLQAAENELQRILQKDPQHIPALLHMGEVMYQSRYGWQSEAVTHYWERVIALEPQNHLALQSLTDYYIEQAEQVLEWYSDYESAIPIYEKALSYQPANSQILIALGYCHIQTGKREKGQAYYTRAIQNQPQNDKVYSAIITRWFMVNDFEAGWQTMLEAEKNIPNLGFLFYAIIAENCYRNNQQQLSQQWIDRAIEKSSPDEPVYLILGEIFSLSEGGETMARTYLRKAIEMGQQAGQAHLILGIVAGRLGQIREAEQEFKTAEKIARQTKDSALATRIREIRAMFNNPFAFFARKLGGMPNLTGMFNDLFDGE